jgi:hypothetical protein
MIWAFHVEYLGTEHNLQDTPLSFEYTVQDGRDMGNMQKAESVLDQVGELEGSERFWKASIGNVCRVVVVGVEVELQRRGSSSIC